MHMINLNNKTSTINEKQIQWMLAQLICIVIFIYINWESIAIIDVRKMWNKKKAKVKNLISLSEWL